jgi:isoquinoline 1-oxidoreductase alpha subunit
VTIRFTLNDQPFAYEGDPEKPLLWVIRDEAGLTGTKFRCGIAACGACTIHVDGVATRCCTLRAADAENTEIRTIEGLRGPAGEPHPAQSAWIDARVPQCGYCQSGMIMAATALLAENPEPTDADIDEAMTNLCRCGTYPRVRAAIHALVRESGVPS